MANSLTPQQLVDILADRELHQAIERYDEICVEIQHLHNQLNTPPWHTYTEEEAEAWRDGCWSEIDALVSESLHLVSDFDLSRFGRPDIKY